MRDRQGKYIVKVSKFVEAKTFKGAINLFGLKNAKPMYAIHMAMKTNNNLSFSERIDLMSEILILNK